MKALLFSLLLTCSLAGSAQTVQPHHRTTRQHTAVAPRQTTAPKVYVCGGGSAYTYHSSQNADLNRYSHEVSAVTVAEAEGMGRRPCKKCY